MPTLNWIGKEKIVNHDKEVPFRLLRKNKKLSLGKSENLVIEGDNLEALKALMPYYHGSIKCIYIDPPYNTGNEKWVYNDKVNSPKIKQWLGQVVDRDDLSRHDKWLCMMYPRLKLLSELLKEEGVIFVSIDDNEIFRLRILMNEIFGEENFIAQLPTVMNLKGNQDEYGFAGTHEYTLVYCKNKEKAKIGEFTIEDEEIEIWEQDDYGYFKKGANLKGTGINAPREKRPNLFYPIFVDLKGGLYVTDDNKPKSKNDTKVLPITDGKEMSWRWEKKKVSKEKHNIIVSKNERDITFYKKQRPAIGDLPSKKPKTIFYKPEYSSGNGTQQMKEIFGKKVFNNPKPLQLIKDFIVLATDKNSVVLDSFAGSGTTAHAVLDLNKDDNGNRKFILVEMEENICRNITSERIRRVAQGYSYNNSGSEKIEAEGLDGGFEYVELGETLFNSDGTINKKVSLEDMARYVYFTETHTNLDKNKIKGNYIGEYSDTNYFLLFDGIGKNILNRASLKELKMIKGNKLVYADKCLLDEDILEKYQIIFKQIPYSVKVY